MSPTVSVLMPVYNAELFVGEAIESIIHQSFKDFEFIIVEDGSEDNTRDIIDSFQAKDSRIQVLYNDTNKGLIYSLNRGIEAASGTYIARMDADDVSLSHRFVTQVSFMEANKDIAVSSAWMETFGQKKETLWKSPLTHDEIMAKMFSYNCVWHPVSIIRKEVIDKFGLRYNPDYPNAEDYKLWVEIVRHGGRLANLPEVLHKYRIHENQKTQVGNRSKKKDKKLQRRKELPGIRVGLLAEFLSREVTLEEVELHAKLFFDIPFFGKNELKKLSKWVNYLIYENKERKSYIEPEFSTHLRGALLRTKAKSFTYYCSLQKRYTPKILWKLFFSEDKYYLHFSTKELVYLVLNSLIFRRNKKYASN